jgi:HSP20 family protein
MKENDMKLDLSKWNPFKFFRKTPQEKRHESTASTALATSPEQMSAAWPEPSRLWIADPFRMMQERIRDPLAAFGQLDRWFGDFSPSVFTPRLDVVDTGDALRITAELPGMDREDVAVVAEDDALVLRGEKRLENKSEEEGCYRLERAFGSFQRVIPLPADVDIDRAEARFEKSVLTIHIPKVGEEKSSARLLEIK